MGLADDEPPEELRVPFIDYAALKARYRAWTTLCVDYTPDRQCGSIKPPKVERKKMPEGLRGYYDGGDTVYINRELRGYERDATLIHEMSHYLDTQLGLNPEMPVRRSDTPAVLKLCQSEQRAWDLTDQWWEDRMRGRKAKGRWVQWYDHCRPFAHHLYPDVYEGPLPARRQVWWFWFGRS